MVKTVMNRIAYSLLAAISVFSTAPVGAAGLVDPMRPSYVRQGPPVRAGLVLQSTVVAGARKYAIINGRLLREGDRIGRARVIEIRRNEAIVQKGKRRITLRVMPRLAKKYSAVIENNGSNETNN